MMIVVPEYRTLNEALAERSGGFLVKHQPTCLLDSLGSLNGLDRVLEYYTWHHTKAQALAELRRMRPVGDERVFSVADLVLARKRTQESGGLPSDPSSFSARS